MEFIIDTAEALKISDSELYELLMQVYVEEGYTDLERGKSLFEPAAVRERGKIIGAREKETKTLAGMVIIVPSHSPACRFARDREVEMHLLGVMPDFRRLGLGKKLVNAVVDEARENDCSSILLWTQKTMKNAHILYEKSGFVRIQAKDFHQKGRDYMFFEKKISPQESSCPPHTPLTP